MIGANKIQVGYQMSRSIDDLLRNHANLHNGVMILIDGCMGRNSNAIYDWDTYRGKDANSVQPSQNVPQGDEDMLYKMARLLRNTDGLYPTEKASQISKLLLQLRSIDVKRYDELVMNPKDKT